MMVVEFARNVAGLERANSRELEATTPYPVIDLMDDQIGVEDKGGTMRLGAYAGAAAAGLAGGRHLRLRDRLRSATATATR